MELTAIVGIGAGGHGRVIADIISRAGIYRLAFWLDHDTSLHDTTLHGATVKGNDSVLSELQSSGVNHAFIGVGSIGDTGTRRKIAELALDAGVSLPSIQDPSSLVSQSTKIMDGVCVFPHAVVNSGGHIGQCAIINTRATLEHDCTVGDFCHLAPACVIGGGSSIGSGAHIGIGAVIKEGISIGKNAIIGAGAVVISDVAAGTTVVGVPAKSIT